MNKQINSVSVENYKAFRGKHTIELKNLTLLFGYNNTGKSALIRLFPLLKDSFSKNQDKFYTPSYLDYSSPSIRGALFNQLNTKDERKLSFGLNWDENSSLDFTLQQDGLDPEVMSSLKIRTDGHTYEYQPSLDNMMKLENKSDSNELISFHDFKHPENDLYNRIIENFSNSIHWVSSTRIHPPRKFEVGIGVPLEVLPSGDGVGPMLWYLAEHKSASIEDINAWLLNTCNRKLDFRDDFGSISGRKFVSLETVNSTLAENGKSSDTQSDNTEATIRTPILDSGEGIAQALPVVVLCAMAANGELGETPVIAVEQPELHLHPQATVELASFLITCIKKNPNVRFVLETHSESFLRALQIAIVKGSLNSEKFSCYWVSHEHTGSKANKVNFDSEGFITSSWPQGVFREAINQAKQLVSLRQNKG
ncbi:AAA domain-containing protein [Vibrio crassostreae]|nr:AAA domain-containing protein [Vibrio crassostreae]CAK3597775.1 AAA domain-containing protein [Vibrio crassostreae]CAK3622534.1 AAA domain-containing protein [Vibrio crassostreae]CAK3632499.1 AAA domain-containing protein [Vibrio crassostreae]CAK3682433.1 AAA domain-containing protein [Vibrio crassostreae]